MKFHQNLSALHEAILQGNLDHSNGFVKGSEFLTPEARLQIYIDGYRIRLASAIEADFSCFHHMIGDKEFKELVRNYIEAMPPNHYSLDQYHIRFPHYLQALGCECYIWEMAMLESAIAEVFWMPHSPAITADEFRKINPEQLGKIRLTLRKASKLLEFEYDCESYLQKFRANKSPKNKPKKNKNYLLVYRHENTVKREILSVYEYALLNYFAKGMSVFEAIEQVLALNSKDAEEITSNIQSWFATWVGKGYFTPIN
jgi:hypothetical protein